MAYLQSIFEFISSIAPSIYGLLTGSLMVLLFYRRFYRAWFGHTSGVDDLQIQAQRAELEAAIAKSKAAKAAHELDTTKQKFQKHLIEKSKGLQLNWLEFLGNVEIEDQVKQPQIASDPKIWDPKNVESSVEESKGIEDLNASRESKENDTN